MELSIISLFTCLVSLYSKFKFDTEITDSLRRTMISKVAFKSGSSKLGNTLRAKIDSSCVATTYLRMYYVHIRIN
jgi:hypothetical protein